MSKAPAPAGQQDNRDGLTGIVGSIVGIVDDDPRIRHLLTEELLDLSLTPKNYGNAFEVLEDPSKSDLDIILLDLMMPQLDGIECLRKLREGGFTKPIIIFTALSDNEKRQQSEEAGASEYILKPDLFENLEKVIVRHLCR